jgi:hypothetical protein
MKYSLLVGLALFVLGSVGISFSGLAQTYPQADSGSSSAVVANEHHLTAYQNNGRTMRGSGRRRLLTKTFQSLVLSC